jgi:hypothetical protein
VIDRLLEWAAHGESGSLVLRGEAGVGKTALLGYAAAQAGTMTTLSVVGVEGKSDLDFAGLHSLMRPIVQTGDVADAIAAARGIVSARAPTRTRCKTQTCRCDEHRHVKSQEGSDHAGKHAHEPGEAGDGRYFVKQATDRVFKPPLRVAEFTR